LALAAVLIALAVWAFVEKAAARMPDFEVYWRAGQRAAQAEPLYRASDADYQFKYFPAFAVAAIPLGALPLPVAKAVWFVISVTALMALLWLARRALPDRRQPGWWLVGVLIVGLGKYYAEDLVIGQINILLTLVVVGAIVAFASGREARAGALVAVAVVIKPYALILLPWLVARREPRALAGAAAVLIAAMLLTVANYGVSGTILLHRDWWATVTATTADTLTHSDNVSVAAMFTKWIGAGAAAGWLAAVTGVLLLASGAAVFLYRRGIQRPDGLEAALLLALTPLISPQGWDYVLVVTTPALIWLANYHDRLPAALRWLTAGAVAVIGLTLYDLLGRWLLYTLLNLSVITLAVCVVISGLCVLRVRRVA
jgi:hypothetical protein